MGISLFGNVKSGRNSSTSLFNIAVSSIVLKGEGQSAGSESYLEGGFDAPIDYHETSHFQITKAFLNNPEKMLGYLVREENRE